MHTMNTLTRFKGEGMKKISFVLLMVAVMLMAVVSLAYANTGSTYAAWTTAGANTGSLPTPHKDFRLTTVKCNVCHAIHKAEVSGEILLRDTVSNACSYCHIQTATGVTQLYGGVSANYTTQNQYAHNTGSSNCSDCHSTHGANTVTNTVAAGGALSAKILRNEVGPTYRAYQATILAAGYSATSSANRWDAESVFCTKCHRYFANGFGENVQYMDDLTTNTVATAHMHVMTSTVAAYGNPAASPAAVGAKVAWNSSTACRSCHDAGGVDLGATTTVWSFPHYTANASRFLMAATQSGVASVPAGAGYSGPAGLNGGVADGVCLKCHTNGVAGSGVGGGF